MGYGDFHLEVTASLPAQGTAQLKVIALGEQFQVRWEMSESEFNERVGPGSRRELTSLFSTLSCVYDSLEGHVKPWLKGLPRATEEEMSPGWAQESQPFLRSHLKIHPDVSVPAGRWAVDLTFTV